MSASVLRTMDKSFEWTVSGYIREQCDLFEIDIPFDVEITCLKYYHLKEQFKDMVTMRTLGTIFNADLETHIYGVEDAWIVGNELIDINDTSICKYRWKFKLIKLPVNNAIKLGISTDFDAEKCKLYGYFQHIKKGQKYVLNPSAINNNNSTTNSNNKSLSADLLSSDLAKDGDIIEVIMDLKHQKIGLCINKGNVHYFTPYHWRHVNELHFECWKYTLQIMMPPISCIECIAFEIEHNKESDNNNNIDIDQWLTMRMNLYILLGMIVLITSFWFNW